MVTVNTEISALVEQLGPFNTLDPPNGVWIENSDGGMEYDPDDKGGGADWCGECGKDVAMRLNLYTPGGLTYWTCWNDSCGEHDNIPHCASCGKTLAGWPTNYCCSEELAYFEDERDFDPTPENIHIISMVLWNLQWGPADEVTGAWKKIGDNLLAKIEAKETSQ